MERCHEMSQCTPIIAEVTAATEHHTYQGTVARETEIETVAEVANYSIIIREIGQDRLFHLARRMEQPPRRPLVEVGEQHSRLPAAQVDVGGFPPHGVQQANFVPVFGKRGKLDARAVRGQAADDPILPHLDEWTATGPRATHKR